MEFWGIEVKPDQTVKCQPGEERYIHLSQASLGESKKGNVSVPVYVHFGGKKLVIGTLSSDKFPQISYDLVFEKEFELSHGCRDGSVYFTGYTTILSVDGDSEEISGTESESEEDLNPILPDTRANGKPALKKEEAVAAPGKAKNGPSKVKVRTEVPEMPDVEDEDEDSDEDSDEDESGDGDSSDENMGEGDDESDEEESSEEEEKVTPKKPESGKKRVFVSDVKTPTQEKKAKVVTSSGKADGKKGGHTATPYPTKQAAKTQASDSKAKAQKSGCSVSCKSCSKTFGSGNALQSHTKAKHGN